MTECDAKLEQTNTAYGLAVFRLALVMVHMYVWVVCVTVLLFDAQVSELRQW